MKKMHRKGKFRRIFPTLNYSQYKPFFEAERPSNVLLAQRLLRAMQMPPKMPETAILNDFIDKKPNGAVAADSKKAILKTKSIAARQGNTNLGPTLSQ